MLFAGLFLSLVLIEEGTPPVPDGAVAVIEGAPEEVAEISDYEFRRALMWRADEVELNRPPRPGEEEYEQLRDEALGGLISSIWVQSEMAERGYQPSHRRVTRWTENSSEAEFLEERGSTEAEIEDRMRVALEIQMIENILSRQVVKAYGGKVGSTALEERKLEAFRGFDLHMISQWQLRTNCAEGFVMNQCASSPPFVHPAGPSCYEADPEVPPEGCQAPVVQTQPALPGTVRLLAPQGKRFSQRPLPEMFPGGA